jgi:RNA methyltransferase, TrmH family
VLTRKEEKLLRTLSQRRFREAERGFLAEGVRVVEDLLASDLRVRFLVHSSSLGDTPRGAALLGAAVARRVRAVPLGDAEFGRLADTQNPQGVIAVAEIPDPSLDDIEDPGERGGLLVLDAVQDPGNFGTLVRTAEALGACAVLLLPGTVDAWNPKSVRAAMGSSFRLPIVPVTLAAAREWLRARSFAVLAADAAGRPLGERRPRRFALIVGNEGSGVADAALAAADEVVSIPLRGRAESLNVTAAAAILLHELLS